MTERWMRQAACRNHPYPDLWFPSQNDQAVEAKAVCAVCPVSEMCLHYALEHDIREGVWGGHGANSRNLIRLRRRYPDRTIITEGDGDPRHGTLNGYIHHKCRCAPCAKAGSEANANRAIRRRKRAS